MLAGMNTFLHDAFRAIFKDTIELSQVTFKDKKEKVLKLSRDKSTKEVTRKEAGGCVVS